jgi:spermidine/putrescine transport system ATP-binding protein
MAFATVDTGLPSLFLSPRPDMPVSTTSAPNAASDDDPRALDREGRDVEIIGVTRRFGDVAAVDDLSLSVATGSFFSLLGPSGCGKTTTLRLIAGFEQPDEGEILIGGVSVRGVPPHRRNVNTVFQNYSLFPHMNVADNVGYGLKQRGVERDERVRRTGEALELVRLAGYGQRRTWQLSGGQQQRVALARALVNKPTVLLLDEPLGALDLKLRRTMQHELKSLQLQTGITFVYVTHDQEEALTMSDRIAVMRGGKVRQIGTPYELYEAPVERYVADFVGVSNFFSGRVVGTDGTVLVETRSGATLRARLPPGRASAPLGTDVTVAVRPERVRIGPSESSGLPGRLVELTYLGDATDIRVMTEALGEVLVRRLNSDLGPRATGAAVGDLVRVNWDDAAALALTE